MTWKTALRCVSLLQAVLLVAGCSYRQKLNRPGCDDLAVDPGTMPKTTSLVTISDRPIGRVECPLDGIFYQQILTETDAAGTPVAETTPFVVLVADDESKRGAYHAYFTHADYCWREVGDHDIRGERDFGEQVVLQVGSDELKLSRRKNWAPGNDLYVFDPSDNYLSVGVTTGAELVLEGVGTGVTVPEPFEWDATSWTDLLSTSVLDAKWTPSGQGGFVQVSLWLFDVSYKRERITCTLWDDGQATIDAGWAPGTLQGVELSIGRITREYVEDHPLFGDLDVTSFRHIRLTADHLLVSKE